MTIQLPADLERFVQEQVSSGNYPSEDDVVRAALEQLRSQATTDTIGLGSIGAMSEDADLLEQITIDVMEGRRSRSLRLTPDE
jgi:putative addiction module CopG family antidote